DFDLLVIGAGSGGVAASRRAALHGARVAVVEGGRVGGTCVIRGCVPKKLLMYAAQFSDAFREARGYGWSFEDDPAFEMARWQGAKADETARLEGIYRKMLAGSGVELIEGWARFDGPHRVLIKQAGGERLLTAQHVLIATGGAPVRNYIPGLEHCATSDDLLDLAALPDEVAIIGAGYIAVEFASMLARLGAKVALYYRDRLPLRGFDEMLRAAAAAGLQACGIELHPGNLPHAVQRADLGDQAGGSGLLLSFTEDRVREFPWVLNATGRRANTAQLQLDSVGITTNTVGAVDVNLSTMATSAPGIYAIGDVTAVKNLTPVAIAQGRALVDSLFGPGPRSVDLSLVASAVFMLPPMASVGPAEAEALAALKPGQKLHIFETDFRPMKQAFVGGDHRTRMKLLVDGASDRVIAVHMAGHDAPEIVQSLAVALTAGATKAHFDRTIAMHPTAAEEFVLMREPARTITA
ncbi:MAG TPA: glutathione-disulfide reductase, partial [Rubrivivax sp.]|nr:glutathione-disulfide reductase [Rubrivivax sp.]